MTSFMPTVENFTPAVFWTTIYGILALCVLFMIVYKVYDAIVTIIDRAKKKKEAEKPDFAEEVSRKVIEKLEPRFKKIEDKLENDKIRLNEHDVFISGIERGQKNTRDGLIAICKYLMAIVQFGKLNNDSKELNAATAEMTEYLASMIGGNSK
jgi:flagellar biosynthesis/type III secretory pathway M-ring protein FliF/YscJ